LNWANKSDIGISEGISGLIITLDQTRRMSNDVIVLDIGSFMENINKSEFTFFKNPKLQVQ